MDTKKEGMIEEPPINFESPIKEEAVKKIPEVESIWLKTNLTSFAIVAIIIALIIIAVVLLS